MSGVITLEALKLFGHHAEGLERLTGGFLLRGLLRRPAPHSELRPGDVSCAHEPPIVRWALDLEHGVVHLAAGSCKCLLKLRLVVDVARPRVLDLLAEGGDDRGLDPFEAVLEVESGDCSFQQCGKDVAAPRDALELVLRDVSRPLGEPLPEPELLRHDRAACARDDVRANLREPSLGCVAEAVEDGARDRQLENAVAEELEPLVRLGTVLRPGRVLEDLLEPCRGQLGDQAAELVRAVPIMAGAR